jgi:hypothetical protein
MSRLRIFGSIGREKEERDGEAQGIRFARTAPFCCVFCPDYRIDTIFFTGKMI